jgi:hypothetical protein
MLSSAQTSPRAVTLRGLKENGAFLFPQSNSTVLCDTPDLRFSIWNSADYLFAQAILWKDNSLQIAADDKGRQYGDSSILLLDIDANSVPTPNVDRTYILNPSLSKPGLDYCVVLGKSMSTSNMGEYNAAMERA